MYLILSYIFPFSFTSFTFFLLCIHLSLSVPLIPLYISPFKGDDGEVWSESNSEVSGFFDSEEEPPNSFTLQESNQETINQKSLATWLTIILLLLQVRFHLTTKLVSVLFRLFKVFLQVIGKFCSFCAGIALFFPGTYYQALQQYNLKKDNFKKYVVCRACHQVYLPEECVDGRGILKKSKRCQYKGLEKQLCGTVLLKSVELSGGQKIFTPYLTYCYIYLKTSMQFLLSNSTFVKTCELWRHRTGIRNVLTNVYDANIWRDFMQYNNRPFLSSPYTYGLILNLDWFQPYEHLSYSVGIIYLSVLNLPSHIRYKQANMIIVGVLPGPREPKLTVNTYIEPLVNDLLQFWDGIPLYVYGAGEKIVRCALLCVSCDSPASRKTCGFLSHSANLGCTKCKKVFFGAVGQKNYSGFDRTNWVYRSNDNHRSDALKLLHCKTITELKRKESTFGCRYSTLLTLPYFDPIRMLPVDPMHTLFLCVAKYYLQKVWIQNSLISSTQFDVIQDIVDRVRVPAGIGRIPTKICSGFAGFTADQFKSWVLYFSLFALRGILLDSDFECWKHCVRL